MVHSHSHFEFAGFFRRLLAFMLDSLMVSIISSGLLVALFGLQSLSQVESIADVLQRDWHLIAIEHGLPALWSLGFWLLWMATPGKMLLDCEIIDARSQQRARPLQLLIRYLGYFASALPLGLGFLWMAVDRRKQGLHDKLAGTLVVMQDVSRRPLETLQ
jgi:uncharacterized RDD family membrane protein YckC